MIQNKNIQENMVEEWEKAEIYDFRFAQISVSLQKTRIKHMNIWANPLH